jgi:hypothetical protein
VTSFESVEVGPSGRQVADLTIDANGEMTLDSQSGLCRDPSPTVASEDTARRQRTFVCGDTTYQLRPGNGAILGNASTRVMEERVVTECVEYGVDANGNRVCTRYEDRRVMTRVVKQSRIQSRAVR